MEVVREGLKWNRIPLVLILWLSTYPKYTTYIFFVLSVLHKQEKKYKGLHVTYEFTFSFMKLQLVFKCSFLNGKHMWWLLFI